MSLLCYLLTGGHDHTDRYYRLVDEVTPDQWPLLIMLARHPEPRVRSALVSTLPLLEADPPLPEWVDAAVALTRDPDITVRDHACFALAQPWRDLDSAEIREALAARLDDLDRDVRSEALLGLARRRDPRALPRVRAALTRPGGDLWRLELVAAGALGDPSLHPLVLRHLDGWDDDQQRTAEAVVRLTDPAGPGADLFRRVAGLCAARADDRAPDPDQLDAWQLMLEMLDQAPDRVTAFFTATAGRLGDDPDRLRWFQTESAFAELLRPAGPATTRSTARRGRRDGVG